MRLSLLSTSTHVRHHRSFELASHIVCPKLSCAWYHIGEVPVKREDGRSVRRMREQPVTVLRNYARRLPKVECLLRTRSVADDHGKSRFMAPLLPFSIWAMNTWPPGCRRHQHLRPFEPQRSSNIRRIGIAANQHTDLDSVTLDRSDTITRVRP